MLILTILLLLTILIILMILIMLRFSMSGREMGDSPTHPPPYGQSRNEYCHDWAKETDKGTSRANCPMSRLTPFWYDFTNIPVVISISDSSRSPNSGERKQFLLLDCRAEARVKRKQFWCLFSWHLYCVNSHVLACVGGLCRVSPGLRHGLWRIQRTRTWHRLCNVLRITYDTWFGRGRDPALSRMPRILDPSTISRSVSRSSAYALELLNILEYQWI